MKRTLMSASFCDTFRRWKKSQHDRILLRVQVYADKSERSVVGLACQPGCPVTGSSISNKMLSEWAAIC
jgi:hypothetical protein